MPRTCNDKQEPGTRKHIKMNKRIKKISKQRPVNIHGSRDDA